jgi:hypothetical protein
MAVFGGITYRRRWLAAAAPLLALLISDLLREVLFRNGLARDWGIYRGMWLVYGTTALIALLGGLARGTRSPAVMAVTTLGGSCVFFLITNFGVWADGALYPRTVEGLATCYAAAVPFFRNAVLGDVAYATILFGAWALAEARFHALRPSPTLANS